MSNNAAEMREALEIAKKAICNHARANHTCDSLAWESSTIQANCGDILCGHRELCEAKTAIQKALSASPRDRIEEAKKPLRNCDIHTDFNDAITTLANERNWHDGKWDSERYCILASWLLAPAEERKGGGDGSR